MSDFLNIWTLLMELNMKHVNYLSIYRIANDRRSTWINHKMRKMLCIIESIMYMIVSWSYSFSLGFLTWISIRLIFASDCSMELVALSTSSFKASTWKNYIKSQSTHHGTNTLTAVQDSRVNDHFWHWVCV